MPLAFPWRVLCVNPSSRAKFETQRRIVFLSEIFASRVRAGARSVRKAMRFVSVLLVPPLPVSSLDPADNSPIASASLGPPSRVARYASRMVP